MDVVYTKSSEVVFRKIAGENLLLPIKQRAVDLRSIYTLNETAAFIWQHIDGKSSLNEIKQKLCEQFEVTAEQAALDIQEIIAQLESLGFIRKTNQ